MFEQFFSHFTDVAILLVEIPFTMNEKFYYLWLVTFVGLAYLAFRLHYRHRTKHHFLSFLFPGRIYLHPSAKVDYWIFLINVLISPLILVGAGLQAWVSTEVASILIGINDGHAVFVGEWNALTYLFFILGYTLIADFSVYLIHRFHHQSNVFWPLHALHHSAQVLTPVTLFRKHPLWNVLASSLSLLLTGLFQGLFVFVFFGGPAFEVLFGLNTIYVLYNFFGANLRHSHVWLSWGKPLSYVFISPAMHQIHHDPHRMHKNYGEIFALWDWMFGTLYIPEGYEQFNIGLGDEVANPHDSVVKAYWVPLRDMALAARAVFSRDK